LRVGVGVGGGGGGGMGGSTERTTEKGIANAKSGPIPPAFISFRDERGVPPTQGEGGHGTAAEGS